MTINYGEYTSPQKNINPSVKREQDYQDMGERGIEEFLRSPDARTVEDFHSSADTDMGAHSIHHTLGIRQYQASPGHHNHNGENSVRVDGQNLLWGDRDFYEEVTIAPTDVATGFSIYGGSFEAPTITRIGNRGFLSGLIRVEGNKSSGSHFMINILSRLAPAATVISDGMSSGTLVTGPASAGTAHTHSTTSLQFPRRIEVRSNGQIYIVVYANYTLNNDQYVSLDGVTWRVKNA